jgi:hypothetical protein
MKEKIFEMKYNSRTKKFKQINLEKLAKETSDFVKHLNFVFSGTPYRICKVYEGRDKNNLNVYVTLNERGEFCEENKDFGILLTSQGVSVGDWSQEKYLSKKYKGKIKDYDLSKL